MISVGKAAPDFSLEGVFKGETKTYALSDYAGKWLVAFFYPKDFTFICPTEIEEFGQHYEDFLKLAVHHRTDKDLGILQF